MALFTKIREYAKRVAFEAHIKPMIVLFVPQIAMQLYLQLNKTMLGAMVGVSSAGYYDSSDKVIHLILVAVTSIGTVMLPHVANSFKKNETKKVNAALDFSLHFTLLLAIPCMFGIMAIAPRFTLAFFGKKFMEVSGLMRIESIIILAVGVSGVIGYQYLLPTNQLKTYSRSIIIGSVLNIIINAPLIFLWGAEGAMISTTISEIVVTGYQLFKIHGQMNISSLFTEIWEYLVAGLFMFVALLTLQPHLPSGWLGILLLISLGMVVYVVSVLLLRPRHLLQQFKAFRD